jgi:hypothetical protein
MRQDFSGSKGLSAMIVAVFVSALVVVADLLIDTWADGHLLAAWAALWVVLGIVGALEAWYLPFAKARYEWSTGGRWPKPLGK